MSVMSKVLEKLSNAQTSCSQIKSFLSDRLVTVAIDGQNFNLHSFNAGDLQAPVLVLR